MSVVNHWIAAMSAIVAPAAATMALRFSRTCRVWALMSSPPTSFPWESSGTCFVNSSVPLAFTAMLIGIPPSSGLKFRREKTWGLSTTCLGMGASFLEAEATRAALAFPSRARDNLLQESRHMRIALVLQSASGYGWKAGLGVRRFARTRPAWELRVWEPALESLRRLAAWRPDGVVG